MKKSIVTTLITTVLVLAMTITTYAAGSIVGSMDMPNASVEGTGVSIFLVDATTVTYPTEIQDTVNAINAATPEQSLHDVLDAIVPEEIEQFDNNQMISAGVNLAGWKFLSPVMDLQITGTTPSFDNPVRVTFVANNVTKQINVDVLHYCSEHGWEIITGEKVSDNQIAAYFHSASPVVLLYREAKKPSYNGGWNSPVFYPTATPVATALPTAAPVVAPVEKDDVEESDVYEESVVESSEESIVESSEESVVESSEESVVDSSEESGVPAGAEAEGSGSVLPIVLIAAVLVAIGIFLIIFLKKKKDEE
ncbi:MAG: hypothetical protein IJB84_07865 [Lachnospiraceae bacterium]|nr:hypothetical protein [Lachnospiraceae bacterium]